MSKWAPRLTWSPKAVGINSFSTLVIGREDVHDALQSPCARNMKQPSSLHLV